ncbi:cellulose biosynthesis protein BcsN [Microvirga sp. 2TAF3]|uniref:cellulose biosynthesis protein BcsN n=1 Tax=Microvirga sp. 2TAF3 TaxID=3233014 RepID=UPI003F9A26F4
MFAVAASVALAGCSTQSGLRFATLMTEVPASKAMILPPPGGPAVVAVLQRAYQNGIAQEIALSTASVTTGQNAFYASMVNDLEVSSEIDDVAKVRRITPERLQGEMEERLPGIEMQTSLYYVQNKYGPFGFATGRSGSGDLCLYAWQEIEPNKPAILTPGGIISIRLRLCDADATEEQLLRSMYAFTISAYFSSLDWNPYGSPPPVPLQLGQIDAPLYPIGIGASGGAPVPPPKGRPAVISQPSARIVTKDTVLPPQAEPQAPLSGYPVVPPPP